MNPTVLNVIIALLSVVLGYQLKIIRLNKCDIFNPGELDANLGLAYQDGFDDGYNAAETEDDVDEFTFNVEELTGVDLSKPGSYVTPAEYGVKVDALGRFDAKLEYAPRMGRSKIFQTTK